MTDMPVTTEEEPTVLHEYQQRRAIALGIAKENLRRGPFGSTAPASMEYATALTYLAEWILDTQEEEPDRTKEEPDRYGYGDDVEPCRVYIKPKLPDVEPLMTASIRLPHSCGCATVVDPDGIRVDRTPDCRLSHRHWGPDPMPAGCGETTWTITERTTR